MNLAGGRGFGAALQFSEYLMSALIEIAGRAIVIVVLLCMFPQILALALFAIGAWAAIAAIRVVMRS
jgi:hypothetical protein